MTCRTWPFYTITVFSQFRFNEAAGLYLILLVLTSSIFWCVTLAGTLTENAFFSYFSKTCRKCTTCRKVYQPVLSSDLPSLPSSSYATFLSWQPRRPLMSSSLKFYGRRRKKTRSFFRTKGCLHPTMWILMLHISALSKVHLGNLPP